MIEEVEMKPQKEGAAFRTRWLFAGTNYRRMVEPLDIAEYYKEGGKNYEGQRSNHYVQLEKWLEKDQTVSNSRFWVRVDEAVLLCETLNGGGNDEAGRKLIEFENYVFELLKKKAVPPEIFLEKSSYMSWWKEYERIVGASYNSALADFMRRAVSRGLNSLNQQNVESILTLDSCFWASVEEAVLLCETLKSEGNDKASRKLIEFENYVFGLFKNYAASPEIFLEKSSYMSWWKEYERIMGVSNNSALASFMRNPSNYKQYAEGAYDFY